VLGSGLQQLSRASTHGVDLRTFIIGKCIGGATVASLQGVILIFLAGAVDVPYDPLLILGILGVQLLLAFSITAFGVMVAARITQMQSFMGVMQMIVMPMFFISGALFPVAGLPAWLAVLNRLDPLTYAVDPMRRLVFNHLDISDAARKALDPGVTWWGWHVPALLEAAVVLALGIAMLGIAIWEFNSSE
jgi:ABC-2 type transport system permease protein